MIRSLGIINQYFRIWELSRMRFRAMIMVGSADTESGSDFDSYPLEEYT